MSKKLRGCKLKTKHSIKENDTNERHVKVIGKLHSHRLKQEMITSTHHVNQVNKLMSQMTLTKYQLVKQKELFYYSKVASHQVVQYEASQKEKIESDIKYLNGWLMEMAEEVKYANRMENDAVRKASKAGIIM